MDEKSALHTYLIGARETMLWKLEELDEYDIRRPMTASGTNLLGLLRHCGASHLRYFGSVFGRPDDPSLAWLYGDGSPNGEMWVSETEGRADIVDGCRRAWDFADAAIAALPLEAHGTVPWWSPEPVTLHRVLVHVTAEAQRHTGHADIVRELIDGSAGLLEGFNNLQISDPPARAAFFDQVEEAARRAASA